MPGTFISPLWAVHLPDGLLTWPWLGGGFAVAGVMAFLGSWRIRDEEIPRVAVLTAAFFVASDIPVPVPPVSAHLLLNGLIGIVLGWRAALAIPIGLFLQAVFGHGGFTTLGINSCVMALPAFLAWQMFVGLKRIPWLHQPWFRAALVAMTTLLWLLCLLGGVVLLLAETRLSWLLRSVAGALPKLASLSPAHAETPAQWARLFLLNPVILGALLIVASLSAWVERRLDHAPEFSIGLLIGQVAVLATALLNCCVLVWGAHDDWHKAAELVFLAHLPVAAVEGIILGSTVGFLARVKPEMLHWDVPKESQCLADSVP
ncbi:MAG TPA: CbiM family transporter [Gemmataceae bacterium]|jgi:cobalt/nickel transport system permease protein|nr:CbiM family transporter [Gemmataceae bacterium]